MSSTELATVPKVALKRPSMWAVVILNDDYTSMDFVVAMLMQVFQKSETEAQDIMLTIHEAGQAKVGSYTFEVAEMKVHQCLNMAETAGHPLMVRPEAI